MSGTPVKVNKAAAARINLEVLQRQDGQVLEIAETMPHTVVYEHRGGQWAAKNVAGALFLVKRAVEPMDAIMVLNREGMEHFSCPLTAATLVTAQPPMVMLREGEGGMTTGLWTSTPEACRRLEETVQRVISHASSRPGEGELAPSLATLFSAAATAAPAPAAAGAGEQGAPPAQQQGGAASPLVLTKRQLQAMLIRLVQNDQFAEVLHREYLETVRERQGQGPNQ